MKLYFSPSACSLASHIALCEAQIDVELVRVDLKTHTLVSDGSDFYALNPKGYVPMLTLDNGVHLTEGVAILQYVADQKPALQLAPKAGTLERYQLQEWLTFINSEVHKAFGPLWNPKNSEETKTLARQNLGKRFDLIVASLGQHDFLQGAQFSVADAYLFTVLNWCTHLDIALEQWPTLAAYQARIAQRPAVQKALAAEAAFAA